MTAHGHIPYDDAALNTPSDALHDLIDADQFQLRETSNAERPRWDHESKRLIGGDVVYINQPLTTSKDLGAIILMRKPTNEETWTDVGRLGFRGWTAKVAATPDRRILGSFETVDELYVVGRTLFEDLASIHVMSGQSWTTTSDSDHGLIAAAPATESCDIITSTAASASVRSKRLEESSRRNSVPTLSARSSE